MILEPLNAVFRVLMTAVNQQFIHILILRAWNQVEPVQMIVAVDKADFPVAMRLAHRIVALGARPDLGVKGIPYSHHLPTPGHSLAAILAAELALEHRLGHALQSAQAALATDHTSLRLVEGAGLPRAQYVDWLRNQLSTIPHDRPDSRHAAGAAEDALNRFFAQLIAMIEQSFVHAFVLWELGARDAADAAWATSGAAMLQATGIVTNLRCAASCQVRPPSPRWRSTRPRQAPTWHQPWRATRRWRRHAARWRSWPLPAQRMPRSPRCCGTRPPITISCGAGGRISRTRRPTGPRLFIASAACWTGTFQRRRPRDQVSVAARLQASRCQACAAKLAPD